MSKCLTFLFILVLCISIAYAGGPRNKAPPTIDPNEQTKKCSDADCDNPLHVYPIYEKQLPFSAFGNDNRARDGKQSKCQHCQHKRANERKEKIKADPEKLTAEREKAKARNEAKKSRPADEIPFVASKRCSNPNCDNPLHANPKYATELPREAFAKDATQKDGLTSQCKHCRNTVNTEGRNRNLARSPEQLAADQARLCPNGIKHCPRCDKDLNVSNFNPDLGDGAGLFPYCKTCQPAQQKDYVARLLARTDEEVFKDIIAAHGDIWTATKVCSKEDCSEAKPLNEFTLDRVAKNGASCYCKDCMCEDRRNYNARRKEVRDEMKEGGCDNCGNIDVRVNDLAHHDREEKARRSNGKTIDPTSLSFKGLRDEAPKVHPLCKNCHRLETYEESKAEYVPRHIQDRRDFINTEKLRRGHCIDCELKVTPDNCVMFDFDHLPEYEKIANLSQMAMNGSSYEEITDEYGKCDLCCCNCHYLRTLERGIGNHAMRPRIGIVDHYRRFLAGQSLVRKNKPVQQEQATVVRKPTLRLVVNGEEIAQPPSPPSVATGMC